ncbi:MAG TPA: hypothetical protein VK462_03780, partial [Nitrososphaeraceae archaeon]|nr:hypothetical protein [Nitrososphaeraceae archaeon]
VHGANDYSIVHAQQVPLDKTSAIELIEHLYSSIVHALHNAAVQTIPSVETGCLKFWWDQELNCYKDKAILSNNRWIAAGKPRAGVVFEEKKKDKYAYRCCIRQKKNRELGDITNTLHESLLSKNPTNFWKTWKNKFGNKAT